MEDNLYYKLRNSRRSFLKKTMIGTAGFALRPITETHEKNIDVNLTPFNVTDIEQFSHPHTPMPYASFRVIFGLKDIKPTSWDGQVIPDHNQCLEIEADRLRYHQYDKKVWSPDGMVSIKLSDVTLPNDYIKSETSWICSTRESIMHGPTTEWNIRDDVPTPVIQQPSILIHLHGNSIDQNVYLKTAGGDFSFIPQNIISSRTGYFLDKNIKVESVPPVQRPSDSSGHQDYPSILSSKSGKLWVAWQEYNGNDDFVLVRSRSGSDWSPIFVLTEKADVFHTALAEDSKNRIWAAWSMQVGGKWDLYGRLFDGTAWSEQERITSNRATKNIYHKMVTDTKGRMWLIWQRTDKGYSQIYAKYFNGMQWSEEEQISESKSALGNNWWPSVATGPDGSLVVVWDGYASGHYDVYLRRRKANKWEEVVVVAGSERFEAHPTVAIDNNNRIWVAWDESDINWGKNTGFLLNRKATQLRESRSIGIACLDGEKWLAPREDLYQVIPPGEFWELPYLQIDSRGKPLLFLRHLVKREPDTPSEAPFNLALWEIHMTRYNGSRWTEPVCLPRSTGRNDMMPSTTLSADGNVWAVWATDLRDTKSFQLHQLQVQFSKIGKFNSEEDLTMKPFSLPKSGSFESFDTKENKQVQRIRNYKIQNSGKTYSIFRGDLHRHTDISHDGYNDGSLLDAYRYARDAAALDFMGVTDHTTNAWAPYNWWRNQKLADLFQNINSFVSFYGYERSVEYPNGHRNVYFTKRGSEIMPICPYEARGAQGTGRLFWYLRRNNGFCISHTTGRTSGTDWRDNDPEVESLIEIYQGFRDSYEYPGSPRPYKLYSLPKEPVPRASSAQNSPSFRAPGFASKVLELGHKMGFIASSDHVSTHISYACFIAEELTPECLLEAVRERRAYAATDNIILDIKHISSDGIHLMGGIFESITPINIKAEIIGTAELQQIDIIKNNAIVYTCNPNQEKCSFEFVDNDITSGESYYYVRVIQKNGEMAWGSPVWVKYKV